MTGNMKKGIGFLISGNISFIIGSLVPIVSFIIAVILIITDDPQANSESTPSAGMMNGLFLLAAVFLCVVIGSIVYFIFYEIGRILILNGLFILTNKSKCKTIRQIGKTTLLILISAIFITWLFTFSLMLFFLNIQDHLHFRELVLFFLIILTIFEYLAILIFSISSSIFSLRVGKGKKLSIINIAICIILAPGPMIIYSFFGISKTGAFALLCSVPVILSIAIFLAILNVISLGIFYRRLPNKNKNKTKWDLKLNSLKQWIPFLW